MRLSPFQIGVLVLLAFLLGYIVRPSMEPFETLEAKSPGDPECSQCGGACPCSNHPEDRGQCPKCPRYPDMSKYVLKSSIPPIPPAPDMKNYMLKTECPPVPDLSQYVLKSSMPKQDPIIIDNSACKGGNCGECPPCPRPRCPEVKCPEPTVCPMCAPCPRAECPQQTVKCKAETKGDSSTVRPFLAPLNMGMFGGY